jgi:hypothetical protein
MISPISEIENEVRLLQQMPEEQLYKHISQIKINRERRDYYQNLINRLRARISVPVSDCAYGNTRQARRRWASAKRRHGARLQYGNHRAAGTRLLAGTCVEAWNQIRLREWRVNRHRSELAPFSHWGETSGGFPKFFSIKTRSECKNRAKHLHEAKNQPDRGTTFFGGERHSEIHSRIRIYG